MSKLVFQERYDGLPFEQVVEGSLGIVSFLQWLTNHHIESNNKRHPYQTVAKIEKSVNADIEYRKHFFQFMDYADRHASFRVEIRQALTKHFPEAYQGLHVLFSDDPGDVPVESWCRLLKIQHCHNFLQYATFTKKTLCYLFKNSMTTLPTIEHEQYFSNVLAYTHANLGTSLLVRHWGESKKVLFDALESCFPYLESTIVQDQAGLQQTSNLQSAATAFYEVFSVINRYSVDMHEYICNYRKHHPWTDSFQPDPLLQFWAYGFLSTSNVQSTDVSILQNFHLLKPIFNNIYAHDQDRICKLIICEDEAYAKIMTGRAVRWSFDHDASFEGAKKLMHNFYSAEHLRLLLHEMIFHPDSKMWDFPWHNVFRNTSFDLTVNNHLAHLFWANNMDDVSASKGVAKLLEHPSWLPMWCFDLSRNTDRLMQSAFVRLLKRSKGYTAEYNLGDAILHEPLDVFNGLSVLELCHKMHMLASIRQHEDFNKKWSAFYTHWESFQTTLFPASELGMDHALDLGGII